MVVASAGEDIWLPCALSSHGSGKAPNHKGTWAEKVEVTNPHKLGKGPSPINGSRLSILLGGYPDRQAVQLLLQGFVFGFRIQAPPPTAPTWVQNLPSVVGIEEVVRLKIEKKVKAGRG